MNERKKWKAFLLIALGALLLDLALSPLRGYFLGMPFSAGFSFFVLGIYTYLCIRKCKKVEPYIVFLAVLVGWSLINIPIRIVVWDNGMVSLLETIMRILGIIAGYLFWKSGNIWRAIILIGGLWLSIYVYFWGYKNWTYYLNYGSVSGNIEMKETSDPILFITNQQDTVRVGGSLKEEKIFLLEFWTTTCGQCFRSFPKVQAFYEKYKNNPEIALYAVNVPYRKDKEDRAFEMIKELKYSFPVGVYVGKNGSLNKYGVNGYPTVLVVNKEGNIIFRGDMEKAIDVVEKLLK